MKAVTAKHYFRRAHAAGKSINLVGSRTNGPATVDGVAWPRTHEGFSGYTIPALLSNNLTPNNIKTYKPNIVLLMIGTNDLSVGEDMPEVRLAGIVDTILSADPKLLLFLTQITPPGQSDKVSYNHKGQELQRGYASHRQPKSRRWETHPADGHEHAVPFQCQLLDGPSRQWRASERCRVQADGPDLVRRAQPALALRCHFPGKVE